MNRASFVLALIAAVYILLCGPAHCYQLCKLKERPLPDFSKGKRVPTAADYHDVPVDLSDKRSGEPLVKLSAYNIACDNFYSRNDGLNAPYYRSFAGACREGMVRQAVAVKLAKVNEALAPFGVELLVFDAYRPLACQSELWSYFLDRAKAEKPQASQVELKEIASRYCASPDNFKANDCHTWPSHCTGGAVDLTLRRKGSGELLFMGGIFDDDSPVSHTDYFENSGALASPLSASNKEARNNRRLLYWSMQEQGFANYPYEWWHFDYGDQIWVIDSNIAQEGKVHLEKAFYGAMAQ